MSYKRLVHLYLEDKDVISHVRERTILEEYTLDSHDDIDYEFIDDVVCRSDDHGDIIKSITPFPV